MENIRKKDYQQIKPSGLGGRNPEENEIRHPIPPDFNMDKDARFELMENPAIEEQI